MQTKKSPILLPEVWGGIECTINRINDTWSDQLLATGHYSRPSDIEKLAELGITTLRYPILWERHQPDRLKAIDWTWADRQLNEIRRHGMTPVAGLLHHGSGPSFTQLNDPAFPAYFAEYAGHVARRFPWLTHYTPINEPLTTARFSGLYGIWYPHGRDPLSFLNILLQQAKAIALAMAAIRKINSDAILIQTEDLACIHSTPMLAYQAEFENHRRWLTFDLLSGRVDKHHPLWDYLLFTGVDASGLAFFSENPCLPDICGVNYYITSERYLDENTRNYAPATHGGNGVHDYADTAAVRSGKSSGLFLLLHEIWERYRLPIAVTEAHLHCTREDQIRWIASVWEDACRAKSTGVDVRAVTAWSLLGSQDWDSLLTENNGHYESGAYRVTDHELQLTAVGHVIRSLAAEGKYDHPLMDQPGWWKRDHLDLSDELIRPSRKLWLIGHDDEMSGDFLASCLRRGIPCKLIPTPDDRVSVERMDKAIQARRPWGVIILKVAADENPALDFLLEQAEIPYLQMYMGPGSGQKEIDDALDAFIDHATTFSTTNINTFTPYAEEQIHVCNRD